MKIYFYLILFTFIVTGFIADNTITVDKEEAQKAFAILKEIRNNPNKYFRELSFDKDLKTSTIQLRWNDTLVKVAERKAYHMANRNYFEHVDPDGYGINYFIDKSGYELNPEWTRRKSDNYFESLTANLSSGEEAIKYLIKDNLTPTLGHRKHLLGIDKWNSTLTDIGIGFIRRDTGSTYKSYICVIIAKHN